MLRDLRQAEVKDKNVLLRIDADVPIKNGKVLDDARLRACLPTIRYLVSGDIGTLTIIGHLGRPKGKVVEGLRLKPVEKKLAELLGSHRGWKMRENLRFSPGEEENSPEFAKRLAAGQDIFVQDAFATCHRSHASTAAILKALPAYAGFSVQREIENLSALMTSPAHPFIVIIGGAKVEDKKPVIDNLLAKADRILVGGVVANKLQKDKGKLSPKIILPVDGLPALEGLDIGPETIALFEKDIQTARTIFWAGPMGKYEEPGYSTGSKSVALAILKSRAQKYAGGGDTTAYLRQEHLERDFDFLSNGGGATLEFLAGKKLPGLG